MNLVELDQALRKLRPTPTPRTCSNSSCDATSGPPRCSPRTARSTSGESCSATPPPSPRCSTACSITRTCSSAGRAAGAPRSRQPRGEVDRWAPVTGRSGTGGVSTRYAERSGSRPCGPSTPACSAQGDHGRAAGSGEVLVTADGDPAGKSGASLAVRPHSPDRAPPEGYGGSDPTQLAPWPSCWPVTAGVGSASWAAAPRRCDAQLARWPPAGRRERPVSCRVRFKVCYGVPDMDAAATRFILAQTIGPIGLWYFMLITLVVASFALGSCGIWLLRRNHGGGSMLTITFRGHAISLNGPSGIVCVAIAVGLLMFAANLVYSQYSIAANQQPPAASVSWGPRFETPLLAATLAEADERAPDTGRQEADTQSDTLEPCDERGWVYVGPASDDSEWAFSLEDDTHSRSPTAMLQNNWIRAKQSIVIREDHYDTFTGTWIGELLGSTEPDVVGVIEKGARAYVYSEARVGPNTIWAEIPCPDTVSDDPEGGSSTRGR